MKNKKLIANLCRIPLLIVFLLLVVPGVIFFAHQFIYLWPKSLYLFLIIVVPAFLFWLGDHLSNNEDPPHD